MAFIKGSREKKYIGKICLLYKSMSFPQKELFLLSIGISPARLYVGLLGWEIIKSYIVTMDLFELGTIAENAEAAKEVVPEQKTKAKQKVSAGQGPAKKKSVKSIPTKKKAKAASQKVVTKKVTANGTAERSPLDALADDYEALAELYEELASQEEKYSEEVKELAAFGKSIADYGKTLDELCVALESVEKLAI